MDTDRGLAPVTFQLPPHRTEPQWLEETWGLEEKPGQLPSLSDDHLSRAVLAATSIRSTPTQEEFLARLNDLRVEKQLSYDRLGRRCRRMPELRMSRSGVYAMLTATQLPTHQQLAAYLALCDVSPHENTLWLTEYARIVRATGDESIMGPAAPQAAEDPRPVAAREQPDEPAAWRRPRWVPPHRRYITWHAAYTFGGSLLAVTAAAILLTWLGVSAELIAVTFVAAAGGVTVWVWSRLTPAAVAHHYPYPIDQDHCLESNEPVPVQVIGDPNHRHIRVVQ